MSLRQPPASLPFPPPLCHSLPNVLALLLPEILLNHPLACPQRSAEKHQNPKGKDHSNTDVTPDRNLCLIPSCSFSLPCSRPLSPSALENSTNHQSRVLLGLERSSAFLHLSNSFFSLKPQLENYLLQKASLAPFSAPA